MKTETKRLSRKKIETLYPSHFLVLKDSEYTRGQMLKSAIVLSVHDNESDMYKAAFQGMEESREESRIVEQNGDIRESNVRWWRTRRHAPGENWIV